SLMSVIITFMFEPAKLQMNWASARGRINLLGDITARPEIRASPAATGFSVTRSHDRNGVGARPDDRTSSHPGVRAVAPRSTTLPDAVVGLTPERLDILSLARAGVISIAGRLQS